MEALNRPFAQTAIGYNNILKALQEYSTSNRVLSTDEVFRIAGRYPGGVTKKQQVLDALKTFHSKKYIGKAKEGRNSVWWITALGLTINQYVPTRGPQKKRRGPYKKHGPVTVIKPEQQPQVELVGKAVDVKPQAKQIPEIVIEGGNITITTREFVLTLKT